MVAVRHLSLVPSEPAHEELERKVADTDDGFIMLAMSLYEELIGANLTRNQAKVAHAVCRKTYGFKKKMDRIADSQLAEICRISRPKVNIAKNELISMKVLVKEGGKIGPNKNISEWQIPDSSQIGNIVTKAVTNSVTKPVTQSVTKTEHTKDISKYKKEKPTLTRLEGGEDDISLKEKLVSLLQGKFNFDNAKGLHDAVETELLKAGYLCQREFVVPDRGDGRKGKVDLYVTDLSGASCGIELDWKSPREKSIIKLQQLPAGMVLLRESSIEDRYDIGGISVVNANDGEIDKTPSGYYQSFLDAYNEITNGSLPMASELNAERKRKIKILVNKLATPNIDGYRAYVRAFVEMAKPFYFGDNNRGWVADFDYLLRPNVLTKIREGNL